jgi:hypothetical protein
MEDNTIKDRRHLADDAGCNDCILQREVFALLAAMAVVGITAGLVIALVYGLAVVVLEMVNLTGGM